MAIFIDGASDIERSTRLEITCFETNGAAECNDELYVSKQGGDTDDVYIVLRREHRVVEKADDLSQVWDAEIYISREQAVLLANFILSICR